MTKLRLLLTDRSILATGLVDKGDLYYVTTDWDRKLIPLYEFRCDKNLTVFLNDELFRHTKD
jgi:hypothetical protein